MSLVVMILAAGRGTRLGELGLRRPKVLVEAAGEPLLAHILGAIRPLRPSRVVLNLHHRGDDVRGYMEGAAGEGLDVAFSPESELLDTGGAVRHALPLFADASAVLVHNGDIWTDADLGALVAAHEAGGADATLMVRPTGDSRGLLVDGRGRLAGWQDLSSGERRIVAPDPIAHTGYAGIHVLSARFFPTLEALPPVVSMVTAWLAHVEGGGTVATWDGSRAAWFDAGTPERLAALETHLRGVRAPEPGADQPESS